MSHDQDFSEQSWDKLLPNPDFFVQLDEINRKLQEIQAQQLETSKIVAELNNWEIKELADCERAIAQESADLNKFVEVAREEQKISEVNIQQLDKRIKDWLEAEKEDESGCPW